MNPLAAAAVVPPLLALGIYTDSSLQLPVAIDDPIDIAEWVVPWENSRPRDPYVGPDGRVWFVGQRSHYVAFLEPSTGRFEQFPLDPGTGPHNLIVDAEGFVWYAGNRAAHIGRLDPRDGSIIKFPMPDESARDPHTLVFDSNGDIWFTVQGGNFVGKLTGTSRTVRLIPVPTAQSRPYGIVVDAQDRPWVVEFGSNKIATIDPEAMTLREIELPRRDARPRRLAITSDGGVWYVDYAGGYLGRLDPETGELQEWAIPGGANARPYAMAVDDRDRLWFVETGPQPNRFIGFDPRTGGGEFFSVTEIESGAGTVRHMVFDAASRAIWFGTDANTIGRARIP